MHKRNIICGQIIPSSVKGYLRLYRAETGLPPRTHKKKTKNVIQPVEDPKDPSLKEYESMSKEELIDALVMARINEARQKRLLSERKWCGEEVSSYRQREYQVILELSGDFPVNLLCEKMEIQRSGFYNWKHTLAHPAERTKALLSNLALFEEYHLRYPFYRYRWLNAKIRLDIGTIMSDPYTHKCCKTLGVKIEAKHYKYKKPGNPFKIYPNLLMTEMQIDRPLPCLDSFLCEGYLLCAYAVHGSLEQ